MPLRVNRFPLRHVVTFAGTPATARRRWRRCALIMAMSCVAAPAWAQQQDDDWLHRTQLTGNWHGVRTNWEDAGVKLTAHWQSESAANLSGGNRKSARYTQQVDVGVLLDLGKLAGIDGGKFQFVVNDRRGRSLSADVLRNILPVQQLYGGGQNFRLSELNYQQALSDGRINLQLGWSPVGDSYAANPYACYFQNNGLCGKPIGIAQDSGGAHNFPVAQWGGRIRVTLPHDMYATAGAYWVNPRASDHDYGWNLSLSRIGTLVPVELGWSPALAAGRLPGQYKVGYYYNSTRSPDVFSDVNGGSAGLTRASFAQHGSRTGYYLMAIQTLWREGQDARRSVSMFATYAKGDPAVAPFGHSWEIGAVYQGPFAGRPDDYLAVAFASAQINPRIVRFQRDRNLVVPGSVNIQSRESFAEINYSVRIAPWLSVRPDLQYVIRPGGLRNASDALVVGLDTLVTF